MQKVWHDPRYQQKYIETLGESDISDGGQIGRLTDLLASLQGDLESIRGSFASAINRVSVSTVRIGSTTNRTLANTVRFTTRFSGDGGAATPIDIAQQSAATGDVLTWNGTYWTPSSLVPGGISSQNVSSGSVGSPSIYFGGNTASGYYSPSANVLGISISGVNAVTVTSSTITLNKNVTIGVNTSSAHTINATTSSSVGATGAAEAIPANPLGYWSLTINGTAAKIPYYTA